MGAKPQTFSGLAGIGDLVVTCMSRLSRNRFLGEQVGLGRSLPEIEAEMQLAQRHGVEMPIVEAVHAILFEGKPPRVAVHDLMTRSAKHEDRLFAEASGDLT